MDLLKVLKSLYQKRFRSKGHLNLANKVLKGINPDISKASNVTYKKSNKNKD